MREVYRLLSECLDILENWNGSEKSKEEFQNDIQNIMDRLTREMQEKKGKINALFYCIIFGLSIKLQLFKKTVDSLTKGV